MRFLKMNDVNDESLLDFRARIALEMISRWGLVATEPNGEDEAGRSMWALMREEDVVTRAITIAEIFVRRSEELGYIRKQATATAGLTFAVAEATITGADPRVSRPSS
ncbi:MAG: hypothetical protein ACREVZ_14180 [Burkholderiales bacterium]